MQQGAAYRLDRQTFTVLRDNELPKPGVVFGMDAEFVALSQGDKLLQGRVPSSDANRQSRCSLQDWTLPSADRTQCVFDMRRSRVHMPVLLAILFDIGPSQSISMFVKDFVALRF